MFSRKRPGGGDEGGSREYAQQKSKRKDKTNKNKKGKKEKNTGSVSQGEDCAALSRIGKDKARSSRRARRAGAGKRKKDQQGTRGDSSKVLSREDSSEERGRVLGKCQRSKGRGLY